VLSHDGDCYRVQNDVGVRNTASVAGIAVLSALLFPAVRLDAGHAKKDGRRPVRGSIRTSGVFHAFFAAFGCLRDVGLALLNLPVYPSAERPEKSASKSRKVQSCSFC
jgi:hypothetical protein